MTDQPRDRFEELLHDAALTYNRPPAERDMPLDAIWKTVESEAFARGAWSVKRAAIVRALHTPRFIRHAPWLGVAAAALVIGIGIGRLSSSVGTTAIGPRPEARATEPLAGLALTRGSAKADTTQPVDAATARYLGQAAALLVALPTETNSGRPDRQFLARASELLLTTRLLLDSPTASELGLRNLLEDLELVLVQVVRLEHERDRTRRTELELIQQALDQRDVLPRLRTAVSEHAADN